MADTSEQTVDRSPREDETPFAAMTVDLPSSPATAPDVTLAPSLNRLEGEGSEARWAPDLPMPRLEGRFSVRAQLGEGGVGEVFAATDATLGREVAIKVLKGVPRRIALGRFLREAQVTAQLSHPNVIPVHGLEKTQQGQPALTMKLVRGVTFKEYMDECAAAAAAGNVQPGRHGIAARVDHFLGACDAIAYSHARGVIHRDIKPQNLMLGAFHEVYVMDWGMAGVIGETEEGAETMSDSVTNTGDDASITRADALIGTPMYMSPEQSYSPIGLTPASDQYALGLVLLELLTLRAGRPAQTLAEAVIAARRSDVRLPTRAENVPAELTAIVAKATAAQPASRYRSVAELAEDLRRWQRRAEVSALPDNIARAAWRRLQRHPTLVMTAILLIVISAATVTTLSLQRSLATERASAANQKQLSTLVSEVTDRAHYVDGMLFRVEVLLESLATTTRNRLAAAGVDGDMPHYIPSDMTSTNAPPGTYDMPRYGHRANLRHVVVVRAPDADEPQIKAALSRLKGMDEVFRRLFLRSAGEHNVELSASTAEQLLLRGVPLHWGYVALREGALLNFPGNAVYAPGYDGRKRSWYRQASGTRGPRWGALYPDASGSGFLLPCNEAIFDRSGALLGVAGLDISMDSVIDAIQIPDLRAPHESWLIDREGNLLMSSRERGRRTAVSVAGNRTKRSRKVPRPLAIKVANGAASGFVRSDQHLYAFARLEAIPWILVARLPANQLGE